MTQSWMLHDHILRDSETYGMNSNFDRVLDGFSVAIINFELSSFPSKNIVLFKIFVLPSVIFSKCVHDMNVRFDMTTR